MKVSPVRLAPPSLNWTGAATWTDTSTDLTAEKLVFWTIALVPLWWILGIQLVVYPLVGWYLFYRSLHRRRPLAIPFGWHMWVLYVGVWLLSLFINLALGRAEVGRSVTATGSIVGVWALMPVTWYAIRRLGIRYQVIVRAIAIVGVAQLVVAVLGELYLRLTGSAPPIESLVTLLVPSIPARIFFDASLYSFETPTWGGPTVARLRSFYYWAPLAGTMSVFVCMGAWGDRNRWWRLAGVAGGIITLWLAAGRLAQVAIVMATLVAVWMGGRRARQLLLWCMPIVGLAAPLILQFLYRYFFEYRTDSTTGRLALYQETYRAFTQSPWLGFGAQGRSQVLNVPLGSHSQTLSTLYQTGLIGSCVLIIAWIAILVALYRLARQHPHLSPVLGAWIGLTILMISGELAAASVTVFTLSVWLGCAWNYADHQRQLHQLPWLNATAIAAPPTPWESAYRWWCGFPPPPHYR